MKKYLLPAVALWLLFCSGEAGKATYIKVYFPEGFAVTAELAVTDEERQQGLMFREKINPDQGMLFVFGEEDIYSFWMKNMRFPIDILWLDKDKRIVHIETEIPPCLRDPCPSYTSTVPAIYVLELQSGSVKRLGLRLYETIDFVLPRNLIEVGSPRVEEGNND